MPDIYGKYSLTEVARAINVTPAFINRVQKETGIGGKIGIQGESASFSKDDIETFRRVKVLRKLDFSFKQIKDIYKLESEILNILKAHFIRDFNTKWREYPLMIHCSQNVYLPPKEYKPQEDRAKTALELYRGEVNKFEMVAFNIKEKKDILLKEMDEATKVIGDFYKTWDELLEDATSTITEISKISKDK